MPKYGHTRNPTIYNVIRRFAGSLGQMTHPGLVLTQLTTWDDWQAVQEFSWGCHWSTFKYVYWLLRKKLTFEWVFLN